MKKFQNKRVNRRLRQKLNKLRMRILMKNRKKRLKIINELIYFISLNFFYDSSVVKNKF